jgi:hypothetical protein
MLALGGVECQLHRLAAIGERPVCPPVLSSPVLSSPTGCEIPDGLF